jgi:predicted O-methyltransferase YrrM
VRAAERAREAFKTTSAGQACVQKLASLGLLRPRAGHYYSPIPSRADVRRDREQIFDRSLRPLPGIEFDEAAQVELLEALARLYPEQPFADGSPTRYGLNNSWFPAADGLYLHLMLRHERPKQVIEVGSGFSSLVMLDTNERFFENRMRLTFVEPNPKRLLSRLRPGDAQRAQIVRRRVQDVEQSLFCELDAGDILFVDSSHVSKVGSDVNYLLFSVLPQLAPGVLVHFHDVPYPFEYPPAWIDYGFACAPSFSTTPRSGSGFGAATWRSLTPSSSRSGCRSARRRPGSASAAASGSSAYRPVRRADAPKLDR